MGVDSGRSKPCLRSRHVKDNCEVRRRLFLFYRDAEAAGEGWEPRQAAYCLVELSAPYGRARGSHYRPAPSRSSGASQGKGRRMGHPVTPNRPLREREAEGGERKIEGERLREREREPTGTSLDTLSISYIADNHLTARSFCGHKKVGQSRRSTSSVSVLTHLGDGCDSNRQTIE